MSSCSSEDEFESADEGEIEIGEFRRETSSLESQSSIAKTSTPTACESVVDHGLLTNATPANSSDLQEHESFEISKELDVTERTDDIPNIESLDLQNADPNVKETEECLSRTEHIVQSTQVETSDTKENELKKNIQQNETEEIVKSGNMLAKIDLEKPQEIPLENEDPLPIPTEIATKISTRSIASRTRQKSKPSLGAKKLGAVRISQPFPESDIDMQEKAVKKQDRSWIQEPSNTETQEVDSSGWGGWFAPPKSLLSSVSSLTNQIIATVETGLNIPDPEDLAREEVTQEPKVLVKEEEKKDADGGVKQAMGFSLMGGVSNLTRFVESTSSKVLNTGLDTLELLGKKTITVLQQTDPGLKKTKAALANPLQQSNDGQCLSQILREAKERNEGPQVEISDNVNRTAATRKKSTTLFEDHHGLFHLEALEMLSQQCESRISSQIRRVTAQRRAVLEEITALCTQVDDDFEENIDPDEFDIENVEQCLTSSLDKLGLQLPLKRLLDAIRNSFELSIDISREDAISDSLSSLAQVTSFTVEIFHKAAELILMADKPANPQIGGKIEAEAFRSIALLLGREVLRIGSHFANQIIRSEHSLGRSSEYSTEIYFEASKYNSYIQNSLKLLVPIIQSRVV